MNLKINFLSICICLFASLSLAQQADNYAFTTNKSSSLINLTNPTRLLGAGVTNVSSATTPIGFEFWFMGNRYTSFSINANGAIQLGSDAILPAGNAYNIANRARIIAFSAGERAAMTGATIGDWRVSANDGVIQYQVAGNAPNRTLVIECRNMNINFQSTTNDATFQIVLYETAPLASGNNRGGRIEFRYAQAQTTYDMNSLRVGFGLGESNNQFKGVDLSTDPPTARIGNDAIENRMSRGVISILNGDADGSRRIFVFESPQPNAQATNLRSACAGEGEVKLEWDNTATNAVGSALYRSTDGRTFTFLTQAARGTNTFTDKGLSASQTYYYRVYSATEGKLSELHPTAQLTYMIARQTGKINIEGRPVLCNGIATLKAEQGFDFYEWYDSGGNLLRADSIGSINISQSGKYKVRGILKSSNLYHEF